MRNTCLLLLLLLIVGMASAQTYKPFQFGIGFGGGGKSGGGTACFYLHPQYNITDNLSVGLNIQPSILLVVDRSGNAAASFGIIPQFTSAYYFTTNPTRPFVGMELGVYPFGTETFGSGVNLSTVRIGPKVGFVPNVGVKLGHFKLQMDYQIFTSMPERLNANMFMFKIGFDIGGGLFDEE